MKKIKQITIPIYVDKAGKQRFQRMPPSPPPAYLSTYEDFKKRYRLERYLTQAQLKVVDEYVQQHLSVALWKRSGEALVRERKTKPWIFATMDYLMSLPFVNKKMFFSNLYNICAEKQRESAGEQDDIEGAIKAGLRSKGIKKRLNRLRAGIALSLMFLHPNFGNWRKLMFNLSSKECATINPLLMKAFKRLPLLDKMLWSFVKSRGDKSIVYYFPQLGKEMIRDGARIDSVGVLLASVMPSVLIEARVVQTRPWTISEKTRFALAHFLVFWKVVDNANKADQLGNVAERLRHYIRVGAKQVRSIERHSSTESRSIMPIDFPESHVSGFALLLALFLGMEHLPLNIMAKDPIGSSDLPRFLRDAALEIDEQNRIVVRFPSSMLRKVRFRVVKSR